VVASPGGQLHGVKRLATTVAEVFARGGPLWGFGLGGSPRVTPWGRVYPMWRPGTLSNHFYVRLRKTHLLHRLARVITPAPRRGRRRGTRLGVRWGRLRRGGSLPVGTLGGGLIRKVSPALGLSTRGATLGSSTPGYGLPQRTPQEGHLRGGWLRRWWRVTPTVGALVGGKFQPPRGGTWGSRAGFELAGVLARKVRRRTFRVGSLGAPTVVEGPRRFSTPPTVTTTPPGGAPRGVHRRRHRREWSPVGVARFQRWLQPFPALLLGGGSLWGGTLLNEATSCGVLLVRLQGSEATPGGVLWNQDPRSLTGVVTLVDHLWGRSFRVALLRTLWGRLSLVPVGG